MEEEAQAKRILLDLLKGKEITQKSAIADYTCYRLSARIHDIRHFYKLPVATITMKTKRKRWAVYKVSKDMAEFWKENNKETYEKLTNTNQKENQNENC